MRNYVTGWRQQVQKEVSRMMGRGPAAPPAAEATPVQPAPAAAPAAPPPPPVRPARPPKPRHPPAPEVEVIDAAPARPRRPFVIPEFGIPRAPIRWIFLSGFLFMLWISTEATTDLAESIWPGDLWWHCLFAQIVISAIERVMFAGNVNGFTLTVWVADAVIVGFGVGIAMLPGLFSSELWIWLASGTPLATFAYDSGTFIGKVLAIGVGAFVAWSGDAMLDLAMRGGR